ncbi:hypothetical protein [Leucobacter denitrificans]|uniref:Uncharacterized protein n=1 Tax=Leucobacter denitrificans TaxID=683042 RepID=A0A7G9S4Z7_9MICO|nr:hypothetical protein [Leucobacter denitrificans]QNN62922.1 hypothetical protein H9L06_00560 [Leucobacter denitrificans]
MRYVLAIAALAISGVLLLLGIGQRTFLAGPVEIVHTVTFEDETMYAVVDGEQLSKVPGQANILMRGEAAFAAVAKTRDIAGWLAPFGYQQIEVDPTEKPTSSIQIRAEVPTTDLLEVDDEGAVVPLDPRGSDLWLDSRSGENGVFRLPVSLTENQSILISGNGEDPIPSGTSIAWVQERNTPWAGPLLAAGGAFALLGAVLYLIAFDRDKRALGPRRGRRGPLIGVQNVVGGMRRRGADSPAPEAPKQGVRSSAPELPTGRIEESEIPDTGTVTGDTGEIILESVDETGADAPGGTTEEIVVEDEGGSAADETDTKGDKHAE